MKFQLMVNTRTKMSIRVNFHKKINSIQLNTYLQIENFGPSYEYIIPLLI